VQTFHAKLWPYKLLDSGYVLASTAMTLSAYLSGNREVGRLLFLAAGILWLISVLQTAKYTQGRMAMARGVRPAPPIRPTRYVLEMNRWGTILLGLMFATILLTQILFVLTNKRTVPWSSVFLLAALFFMQLSPFANSRFAARNFS
jgi:hypothetical protein